MKRPGLTIQLFLAVLATATLVALAMGVAAQFSFSRGFMGYLNAQAQLQMEAALPRLQRVWAREGSWALFRGRPGAWFRTMEPEPEGDGHVVWDADPELLASHLLGAGRRLSLLDADRQLVIGYPRLLPDSAQRAIVVDGRTVGWLTLAPVQSVTDAASLAFERGQWRATLLTGLLSLALAALVAWWMARALLAPVRAVARATHQLAAGRYETRVPVQGQDEVARLGQDFNQLALALARNEQSRREHLADVSHELRTPLAVLRGEIEAMQDGIHPLTPEGLQQLHGEVATLGQLVDDLHALALADVGALRYRKEDLDLVGVLADEAALYAPRCAAQGLQLDASALHGPLPVQADPERLRQLLRNLLGNALRYTDAGGTVRLAAHAEAGTAVIDLQDSTPGVPDELLPRLFERFFRAEGSRARHSGGSGLGLAICRSIVQAHGGSISAQASPLGGVWIQVRLPLLAGTPS